LRRVGGWFRASASLMNPPCVERGASHRHLARVLIFLVLCSNRRAVPAIRAGTKTISPLTQRLGGQHGEEEKGKGSGEEGREKDKAPEEEVGSRSFTVFDFTLTSMTASQTGDCRTASAILPLLTAPAPDDRGRRRDRGSSITAFQPARAGRAPGGRVGLSVGRRFCRGLAPPVSRRRPWCALRAERLRTDVWRSYLDGTEENP